MEREELRRRLRNKIDSKRHGTAPTPRDAVKDPKGLLISMGVCDENILNAAEQAIKSKSVEALKTIIHETKDDEEAPPLA